MKRRGGTLIGPGQKKKSKRTEDPQGSDLREGSERRGHRVSKFKRLGG